MSMELANSWWILVVRGIVGISLGLATLVWPSITLVALLLLFGAYALVDGLLAAD